MNSESTPPTDENDSKRPYNRPKLEPVGTLSDVIWLGFREEDRPTSAEITCDFLMVTLQDGRVIGTPLEWYPCLRNATREQCALVELCPNSLRWKALELEIFTRDLLIGKKQVSGTS